MSIIIGSMDNAYRIFLKVLSALKYDTKRLTIKKLHYANWVVYSEEGIWFFKHSREFFHLKGECESIDVEILDKILKNDLIHYMTFIFAHDDIFYSITYDKFLERRDPVPYIGNDNVKRWLIKKDDLKIWHVVTWLMKSMFIHSLEQLRPSQLMRIFFALNVRIFLIWKMVDGMRIGVQSWIQNRFWNTGSFFIH